MIIIIIIIAIAAIISVNISWSLALRGIASCCSRRIQRRGGILKLKKLLVWEEGVEENNGVTVVFLREFFLANLCKAQGVTQRRRKVIWTLVAASLRRLAFHHFSLILKKVVVVVVIIKDCYNIFLGFKKKFVHWLSIIDNVELTYRGPRLSVGYNCCLKLCADASSVRFS